MIDEQQRIGDIFSIQLIVDEDLKLKGFLYIKIFVFIIMPPRYERTALEKANCSNVSLFSSFLALNSP